MRDILKEAQELRGQGKPFALATVVACRRPTSAYPGAKAIIRPDGKVTGWVGGSCAQPIVVQEALKALGDGKARLLRIRPDGGAEAEVQEGVYEFVMPCQSQGALEIYVEPVLPRPDLIVIGQTPLAQALARLGTMLDFAVCAADPAATREEFPDAEALVTDVASLGIRVGPRAYVVVATMGQYDEDALLAVINRDPRYLGLVASPKRAEAVFQVLRAKGVSEERLARVTCPAGLRLGGVTQEEIALSVVAEILQLHRKAPAGLAPEEIVPAPPAATEGQAVDPICGMTVAVASARYRSTYGGRTYHFCCAGCKETFDRDPKGRAAAAGAGGR